MLIRPQNCASPDTPAGRLARLRAQLAEAAAAAGRGVEGITLLAISKGHPADAVSALAALGLHAFGESYLQEALPKLDRLAPLGLAWHFIGRLQANKTRAVAGHFDWVHGLDRLSIAERLAAQRPHDLAPLNVCVQVQPAPDPGKAGLEPEAARALVLALRALPRLRVRGLMCILPEGLAAGQQQELFGRVAALRSGLNAEGLALDTLSMGMSGDFPAAIAAGATLVRIGTALFGPRAAPQSDATP